MKKKIILIFILCNLLFCSCQPELDYTIRGYTQKIIVEGYIANDEYPVVYLSLNIPFSEEVDSVSIIKNVITSAKVTVSDGTKTEILTAGFWDNKYFPPHQYRGTEIKGEEGKTYYLTIEYGGYTLHAQTTIPHKIENVNFNSIPVTGNDTLRILSMTFNIDPNLKNSFRVYTMKRKDGFYQTIPLLYNPNFLLTGDNTFTISPTPSKEDKSFSEGSYFAKGDTIDVKVCSIDSISTQFFKDLTMFSTATGVGNNIFIGEKDALKSNISLPGFGIWCGSGINIFKVIIK